MAKPEGSLSSRSKKTWLFLEHNVIENKDYKKLRCVSLPSDTNNESRKSLTNMYINFSSILSEQQGSYDINSVELTMY